MDIRYKFGRDRLLGHRSKIEKKKSKVREKDDRSSGCSSDYRRACGTDVSGSGQHAVLDSVEFDRFWRCRAGCYFSIWGIIIFGMTRPIRLCLPRGLPARAICRQSSITTYMHIIAGRA